MSWIKLLLGGLVIAFCVLLGYFAAAKYRRRKSFFAQLYRFHERYLGELSYARRPLDAFLSEGDYRDEFAAAVEEVKSRRISCDFSCLTAEERGFLQDYFSALGKGDSQAQKNYFAAQQGTVEEKKSESEREAKARTELYLKLGLLAGLAFVILIV